MPRLRSHAYPVHASCEVIPPSLPLGELERGPCGGSKAKSSLLCVCEAFPRRRIPKVTCQRSRSRACSTPCCAFGVKTSRPRPRKASGVREYIDIPLRLPSLYSTLLHRLRPLRPRSRPQLSWLPEYSHGYQPNGRDGAWAGVRAGEWRGLDSLSSSPIESRYYISRIPPQMSGTHRKPQPNPPLPQHCIPPTFA